MRLEIIRRGLWLGAVAATIAAHPAASEASSGVVVETVSDYSTLNGNHNFDTDANTEGNGFWNAMTASGSGWTALYHYVDNLVFDTDLEDPEYTGVADHDTTNFDAAGAALSLFIGHGTCDDVTPTACTSDANCSTGGYCPGGPISAGEQRVCIRQSLRRIFTSSTSSIHGNQVLYGNTSGHVAERSIGLGESSDSGGFAGAGTNGGTNVAVIVNSCGIRSHHVLWDTQNFYAGVHMLMMSMPIAAVKDSAGTVRYSDTAQWGARGSTFSGMILANVLATASDAWLNPTMTANSFTGTASHNLGAQIAVTEDSVESTAAWHVFTESWIGTLLDSNDAKGNGFYGMHFVCNYDCATYGD